jgi:glutathione S-transferase
MSQSTNDNSKLVLGYWAIRGLAEPSRLALHYANVSFDDKFYEQGEAPEYSREQWLSEKQKVGLGMLHSVVCNWIVSIVECHDNIHSDFPNLPYLFDGDLKITQSKAILYYLGRKLNLMGKTLADEALVFMLCDEAHDFRMKLNGLFYGPQGSSAEERKKFADTTVNDELKKFDDYFANHTSKFAAGEQVTVADFQLFDYIDTALAFDEEHILINKYANIKRFLQTIRELPELKDYIAKSHAQLPLNNKGR